MIEAWHVDVLATDAVIILDRATHQFRNEGCQMETDLFGEIAAYDVRGVANSIGVTLVTRVEQDTGRIDAGSSQYDDASADMMFFFRHAVEVLNAVRLAIFSSCDAG